MHITDKLSRPVIGLAFAVSAFVLSMPLWMPINGHDGWIHLNWLEQFTRLFREGDLYPRWMPDSFSGFGSPAFYVYPPFSYWFASLLSLTGLHSPESLYFAVTVISIFASGAAFFMYARDAAFSKQSSLLGALCYSVAPYTMIDLAIRNALSEHVAFVWIPFIFIGIERWIVRQEIDRKRVEGAALFIFATAGLALTNIPAFIITCISSVIYILFRKSERSIVQRSLLFTIGIISVSVLTAFYFGTALSVQKQISTSYLWTILGDKPIHRWILGIGEQYQHFRDLFLVLTLLLGVFIIALVQKLADQHGVIRPVISLSILATVFQVPYLTDWLYNFPILEYIQFDQRWNIILVFTSAVSIAVLSNSLHNYTVKLCSVLLVCAGCVPIVVALFFSNSPSSEVVNKYHNDPPEYLSKYVEDTSIAPPHYFSSLGMKRFIEGGDSVSWKQTGASTYEITKSTEAEVDVRFKLQYFTFWWLSKPKMNKVHHYSDKSGVLHARLPKGKGTYYLLPVMWGSVVYEMLSIRSFFLIASVLLMLYFRENVLQLLRKVNKLFNRGV
jgi:hypothetical protein